MNNTHPIPYEVLLERYIQSQREIEYQEHKISSLNQELEAWQKAYEEYADILMEHGLI
ncbi:MAG: hypothetical protein KBT27_07525 [Prevotellaceae bacterium]|nr:hypothetical protein [Candidatus Faecinaster equi]